MKERLTPEQIRTTVTSYCAHPVEGDAGTCSRCEEMAAKLTPHDIYGDPLHFRPKIVHPWRPYLLAYAWVVVTVIGYALMADALVEARGWECGWIFWCIGIVYAVVTWCLTMYAAQAREEAHVWETREYGW